MYFLLLSMTQFACHTLPPGEVSEGIVCVSMPAFLSSNKINVFSQMSQMDVTDELRSYLQKEGKRGGGCSTVLAKLFFKEPESQSVYMMLTKTDMFCVVLILWLQLVES